MVSIERTRETARETRTKPEPHIVVILKSFHEKEYSVIKVK